MKINLINVTATLAYNENNLASTLDLETIATVMYYSKYHLHRVFKERVSLSIHEYVLRCRLTEAAKLLIFSSKSILEITLIAGYVS